MDSQTKHAFRFIIMAGALCLLLSTAYTQDTDWHLVEGKAIAEKSLTLPGKNSTQIYREVNRWLIKVYTNPEDLLKAKLDDEYLRGIGYVPNCIKFGTISSAGLQYTFTFDIKDEKVVFKICDAFLIYGYTQDDEGIYPVENYIFIKTGKKKKERKNNDSDLVLASLTDFSESMFKGLENHFAPTN